MAEKGLLFTGARARLSINGQKVGYARNVSVNEEIEYQPIDVIANIETEEFVPIAYRCSMTASTFRIVGDTMKSKGFFPKSGTNVEEHLENILTNGEMTATIEDTKSGRILANVEQVKVTSKNLTVDARGVAGKDVNFVAIRVKDESEI